MKPEPFVIERVLNAPISKVWNAITNNDAMKQWYFDIKEFKPEIGFEFSFSGSKDDVHFLHNCKVTEVITGKKLTYSWAYDQYPGLSFVSFELFEEGNKTRLKLTHAGLETFPQDNPNFAASNFVAGWTHILDKNLKQFVEAA